RRERRAGDIAERFEAEGGSTDDVERVVGNSRRRGKRAVTFDGPRGGVPAGTPTGGLLLEILEPIHVDEPGLRQRLAHAVDVEPELAGAEALPLLSFLRDALLPRLENLLGLPTRHDDDAAVVRDDHLAGIPERSGANDRNADGPATPLHRPFRVDGLAPDREADLLELPHVATAGVDHETSNAPRLVRRAEKLSEHAVGVRAAERDDDDVARLAKLDRHVQHPVVARMRE